MDIMKHVDYATEFLTNSLLINRMIGYGILSASLVLFVSFAVVAFYRNVFSFKMPWGAVLDPTSDWNSRNTLRQTPTSRPPPLSHRIFTNLTKVSYRKVLFVIFVIEILIGIALLVLFISNAVASRIYSDLSDTEQANN
ncbi:hypothetical protein AB6A40_008867 [Gnathostoma spinigerum]|uniref:Uncharacterized protein n=1 Tax=Gnathostoma spinigerum TaxID=75299 RepID=A0ABD6EQM6_9BILA